MQRQSAQRLLQRRIVPFSLRLSRRSCSTHTTGQTPKRLLLMDANGVIYTRIQKKFASLKAWIQSSQNAEVSARLPGGVDEQTLDASVTAAQKAELLALRQAANRGEVAATTYYSAVLTLFRVPPSAHPAALQVLKQAEAAIRLCDGVIPALRQLKYAQGVRLGVITDSMSSTAAKLDWIKHQGLDPTLFDVVVNSSEEGVTKPHQRMYQRALELARPLGIEHVGQAAFIGHKTAELLGAQEMGLTTITYNPDIDLQPRLAEFDYNAVHWADIPALPIFPRASTSPLFTSSR